MRLEVSGRRGRGLGFLSLLPVVGLTLLATGGLPATAVAQTWADEFNGSGGVDSSIWSYDTGNGIGGWGNNELESYTTSTANVNQAGGFLTLSAQCCYTSGRIKTQGKKSFAMGSHVEARLRGPNGQGLWPAFWALGTQYQSGGPVAADPTTWPGCGEIDIMEHINSVGNVFGTVHWWNNGYAFYTAAQPGVSFPSWNTYAIDWVSFASDPVNPGPMIIWKLNGSEVGRAAVGGINGTDEFASGKSFFVLLNLAVGGNWPGNPDGSTVFPAKMDVDYVHVSPVGGATPTAGPTPTTGPRATPTSGGATPTTAPSGDYTQGVSATGTNTALAWFKANAGVSVSLAIVHYMAPAPTGQQNLTMAFNSATGRYEQAISGLPAGYVMDYWFTYQKPQQFDTPHFSYTQGAAATPTPRATATATARATATPTTPSCTQTAINPFLQVNGGAWQNVASVSVSAGASVTFGPQPTSGGSWKWAGPNGFTATTREITVTANASASYTATYTNPSGCPSTKVFTIAVAGSGTPTTPPRATPTATGTGPTPTPAAGCAGCTHPRLKVNNGCAQTMWVQYIVGNQGGALGAPNHAAVAGGGSITYNIPDIGLAGFRLWPSFGCDGSGNNCTVGASGGPVAAGFSCPAGIGCAPPVDTKFEGSFGCIPPLSGGSCQQNPSAPGSALGPGDWWDTSFVDGFTVPSKVVVHGNCPTGPQPGPVFGPGGPPGGQIDCSGLRLANCPRSENLSTNGQFSSSPGSPGGTTLANQDLLLRHPNADGSYSSTPVGCFSPSAKLTSGQWQAIPKPPFTGTYYAPTDPQAQMYACPSPPVTPAQCSAGPSATTHYTSYIHSICNSYAYAYDDTFGLASCPASANLQYEVTFYCPQ